MALFAEVRGLADDVVLPILDLFDPVRDGNGAFDFRLLTFDYYVIANGYGVGTTDTTNAEVAFYMALHIRTIVHPNDVAATRRFNNETSQFTIYNSQFTKGLRSLVRIFRVCTDFSVCTKPYRTLC